LDGLCAKAPKPEANAKSPDAKRARLFVTSFEARSVSFLISGFGASHGLPRIVILFLLVRDFVERGVMFPQT
jgi:hypothetical protein